MTTTTFLPPPPETWSRTQSRAGRQVFKTASGVLIFGGALSLLLAVLFGIAPLLIGRHPFVVISGSMEPTIKTGSVVITQPVLATDLHVGDVIAFNPRAEAGLPIIHRIVALHERNSKFYATTRGDANTGDDAEIVLSGSWLKVDAAIPLVGYVIYYAAQPIGTLVLVGFPLSLLIVLWLKDRGTAVYHWACTRQR